MVQFLQCQPEAELQRLGNLEPFDEFEEWHLKCAHYVLVCGSSPGFEAPLEVQGDAHPET
eukprot:CAMPEP_0170640266 /NCGR_PEP_ID=MMETSP0224-20130122/40128_1 /TAXON_ID=285029 /ORGANISM="Togula jolla, Strain CCCM 725" /LENGTH=59 /DNA_ID=CAMNT_0010970751 /DNA_START=1 /DNA_END=177 /DNA_ORIENTATION=+